LKPVSVPSVFKMIINLRLDLKQARKVFSIDSAQEKNKSKKNVDNKITLSEYIKNQIEVSPIVEDMRLRYTPNLVKSTFDRLESLLDNNSVGADLILKSFYSLNDPIFLQENSSWNDSHEDKLN
jgi:hypothetical protein